jgi:hypothetical protein
MISIKAVRPMSEASPLLAPSLSCFAFCVLQTSQVASRQSGHYLTVKTLDPNLSHVALEEPFSNLYSRENLPHHC